MIYSFTMRKTTKTGFVPVTVLTLMAGDFFKTMYQSFYSSSGKSVGKWLIGVMFLISRSEFAIPF